MPQHNSPRPDAWIDDLLDGVTRSFSTLAQGLSENLFLLGGMLAQPKRLEEMAERHINGETTRGVDQVERFNGAIRLLRRADSLYERILETAPGGIGDVHNEKANLSASYLRYGMIAPNDVVAIDYFHSAAQSMSGTVNQELVDAINASVNWIPQREDGPAKAQLYEKLVYLTSSFPESQKVLLADRILTGASEEMLWHITREEDLWGFVQKSSLCNSVMEPVRARARHIPTIEIMDDVDYLGKEVVQLNFDFGEDLRINRNDPLLYGRLCSRASMAEDLSEQLLLLDTHASLDAYHRVVDMYTTLEKVFRPAEPLLYGLAQRLTGRANDDDFEGTIGDAAQLGHFAVKCIDDLDALGHYESETCTSLALDLLYAAQRTDSSDECAVQLHAYALRIVEGADQEDKARFWEVFEQSVDGKSELVSEIFAFDAVAYDTLTNLVSYGRFLPANNVQQ